MAVENDSDREVFFAINDFGVTAKYTRANSFQTEIKGIFENEFIDVESIGNVGVALVQPLFFCQTKDVSQAAEGDKLTVNNAEYTIRVVQPDGTGMTTLVLEK